MSLLALLKARSRLRDVTGTGGYIEGPALEVRENFSYIWLTLPDYRVKLLSGGDSRADCRIPTEFIGGSILPFPAG
jgi:hypothetical protein